MKFPRSLPEMAPLMDLRPTARGFVVDTLPTEHGAIMGAHELMQFVLAAERDDPDKRVLSVHAVFVDGGRSGEPVDIAVERMRRGRSFTSSTLTMSQGSRLVSRAVVLLTGDEPDFLRHRSPAARTGAGVDWVAAEWGSWPGPAWRAPGAAPGEVVLRLGLEEGAHVPTVARALTALATEPVVLAGLISLSEGPWEFRQGSGNVVTQSVTLLEPVDDAAALVVSAVPAYAGGGRAHGGGTVTDDDGRLLATFQTTGVLRGPRA